MLYIENETDLKIDKELLEKIHNSLTEKDVELTIVNDTKMREINFSHRGKNDTTDVLSFPLEEVEHAPLGDIVINSQKVKSVSSKLNHSTEEECALLFIHALLHLLGYDHETDNGRMREKEREIISDFNLPESLIVRTK